MPFRSFCPSSITIPKSASSPFTLANLPSRPLSHFQTITTQAWQFRSFWVCFYFSVSSPHPHYTLFPQRKLAQHYYLLLFDTRSARRTLHEAQKGRNVTNLPRDVFAFQLGSFSKFRSSLSTFGSRVCLIDDQNEVRVFPSLITLCPGLRLTRHLTFTYFDHSIYGFVTGRRATTLLAAKI